jgi:hypothetical protein
MIFIYLIKLLGELNDLIFPKCLEQYLEIETATFLIAK